MDYNRTIIGGRLTADPQLQMTNNNNPVCEITLAVNRYFKTSDGEKRKETMFIPVVFWGNRAGTIAEHTQKGSNILVEGRLEQDRWEDKETGKTRSRVRLVADDFQFVGSRSSTSQTETSEQPQETTTSA